MHEDLIFALKRNAVETGSLICLGCGYEHDCGIKGCAIMSDAADAIEALNAQLAAKEPAGNALTIEELLKTKAKPVWCEWKDSGWVLTLWDYIVSFSQGDRHGAVFFISKDGKTWFAYSGSPKEE